MNRSNAGNRKPARLAPEMAGRPIGVSCLEDTTPPRSAPARPDFRQDDFNELVVLLGMETVSKWINELQTRLQLLVEDAAGETTALQPAIHNIIGKAGMLGFRRLAQSCARLEREILSESGITEFETVRCEARDVLEFLADLR